MSARERELLRRCGLCCGFGYRYESVMTWGGLRRKRVVCYACHGSGLLEPETLEGEVTT